MVKIHEWIEWTLFKDISALNSRCEMFKNSQNNSKQSVSCWRSDMSDWQILMAGSHQVQLLMRSTFSYILTHFWVSRGHNQKNEKSLHHDVNPNPVNLPAVSPTVRPTERLKHAIHGCYPTSKRYWMERGKIFDVGFSVDIFHQILHPLKWQSKESTFLLVAVTSRRGLSPFWRPCEFMV